MFTLCHRMGSTCCATAVVDFSRRVTATRLIRAETHPKSVGTGTELAVGDGGRYAGAGHSGWKL